MKDKTRKVIKGIGVGALACVGMFGLTGCSNTKDQLNDALQKIEQLQTKVDKEDACEMIQYSIAKLKINKNGVLDNLTIIQETSDDGGEFNVIQCCKSGNTIAMCSKDKDNNLYIEYTENGNSYWYRPEDGERHQFSGSTYDSIFDSAVIAFSGLEISEGNIVKTDVLSNGNYQIVAVFNEDGLTAEYVYEITKDCDLVKVEMEGLYAGDSFYAKSSLSAGVNVVEVVSLLAQAKAAPVLGS